MMKKTMVTLLPDLASMVVGGTIWALGINIFTVPNDIAPGGATGIATVINHFTGFPVGVIIIIINIPLFILAFFILICAVIIAIFSLTFLFTRDIKKLNAEVSRFGNMTGTDISLTVHSCDEVGQLTEGVISMSHRINRLLQEVQENERNKRILEFNSLQSQVNPHMIYNTLNTITYLAELQNAGNIREISSSFAFLLRSISNQGEFISISQEIEYLKSFIAIKKYNMLSFTCI